MSNGVQLPGKEMLNKKVLSRQRKVSNDDLLYRVDHGLTHLFLGRISHA